MTKNSRSWSLKASCSTRVPVILGAITLAKSSSLVLTSSWSSTDPAAWTIPRTGRPPSRTWSLSQAVTCSGVGDVDAGGGDLGPEALDRPDRRDGREVRVSSVSAGQRLPRRDGAAAQQRDVPCAALGEVGRHDTAECSRSAGDDVGRVGAELGGERPRQARCTGAAAGRTSCRRGSRSDPRVRRRGGVRRCGRRSRRGRGDRWRVSMSMRPPQCSANSWWPMTRPSPQTAAWSTDDGGSGCRLRVGGDEVQPGSDGVALGERLDQTQHREYAQLDGSSSARAAIGDVERPAVDDASRRRAAASSSRSTARGAAGSSRIPVASVSRRRLACVTVRRGDRAPQLVGEGGADAGRRRRRPARTTVDGLCGPRSASGRRRTTESRTVPCRCVRATCATRRSATAP